MFDIFLLEHKKISAEKTHIDLNVHQPSLPQTNAKQELLILRDIDFTSSTTPTKNDPTAHPNPRQVCLFDNYQQSGCHRQGWGATHN